MSAMCVVPLRRLMSAEAGEAPWADRGVPWPSCTSASIPDSSQSLMVGPMSPVQRGRGVRSWCVHQWSWTWTGNRLWTRVGRSGQQRPEGIPPLPCMHETLTASISVNCCATSWGGKTIKDGFLSLAWLSTDSRDSQEAPLGRNAAGAGSSSRDCVRAGTHSGEHPEYDWCSRATI